MTYTTRCDSPIGALYLISDGTALTEIALDPPPGWSRRRKDDAAPFARARKQLDEYFHGKRTEFDLPLAPTGTPFQRRAWDELAKIPYGTTISYGEQARRVGRPKGARAVGMANGRNPLSIVVPCHRVIGADGSLVGYGGGLAIKKWLLEFELAGGDRKSR